MIRAIEGVNGIWNPTSKNGNTDEVLGRLWAMGLPTNDVNYPTVSAFLSYSTRIEQEDAQRLIDAVDGRTDDIVFAHSRGALVVRRACLLGAKFSHIVLFGAAMDANLKWPKDCVSGRIICCHNPKDKILRLGSLLPFHRFGLAGKTGMKKYVHPRLENINVSEIHRESTFWGHSDYFMEPNITYWTNYIANLYNEE